MKLTRKKNTWQVVVLRFLDRLARRVPILHWPCYRLAVAILNGILRRERRRQGITGGRGK